MRAKLNFVRAKLMNFVFEKCGGVMDVYICMCMFRVCIS